MNRNLAHHLRSPETGHELELRLIFYSTNLQVIERAA